MKKLLLITLCIFTITNFAFANNLFSESERIQAELDLQKGQRNSLEAELKAINQKTAQSKPKEFTTLLKLGSTDKNTNKEVTKLQKFLYPKYLKDISVLGFFGKKTQTALKDYQTDNSLKVTGNLDLATRNLINAEFSKSTSQPVKTTTPSTKNIQAAIKNNLSVRDNLQQNGLAVKPSNQSLIGSFEVKNISNENIKIQAINVNLKGTLLEKNQITNLIVEQTAIRYPKNTNRISVESVNKPYSYMLITPGDSKTIQISAQIGQESNGMSVVPSIVVVSKVESSGTSSYTPEIQGQLIQVNGKNYSEVFRENNQSPQLQLVLTLKPFNLEKFKQDKSIAIGELNISGVSKCENCKANLTLVKDTGGALLGTLEDSEFTLSRGNLQLFNTVETKNIGQVNKNVTLKFYGNDANKLTSGNATLHYELVIMNISSGVIYPTIKSNIITVTIPEN